MSIHYLHRVRTVALLAAGLVIAACSNDDLPPPTTPPPPPASATFEVSVTNLTNAQPLSPIAVIAHGDSYRVFAVGEAATVGLEELAEGGVNGRLFAEAAADSGVLTTAAGAGPVPPGASASLRFTVELTELPGAEMSVITMLVNTNDAFTGISGVPIGDLAVGDSRRGSGIAYDAGTEANTEEAIHIPGPVGGGEGFNADRNDRFDRVTMHSGVVGRDDGFASSDLDNQHRFDNPVLRATITRVE